MKKMCTSQKRYLNFLFFYIIILFYSLFVKENRGSICCRDDLSLLFAEGLAIGALIHGGVGLVGAHKNAVQRAVVLIFAVVCTLLNGAFDTLVCVTVHSFSSFDLDSAVVCP